MKYFVVEPLSLETPQGTATLQIGQILELSLEQAARLGGKVERIPPANDGRDLPCYCQAGDCHCSTKLPDSTTPCHKCGATAGKAIAGQGPEHAKAAQGNFGSRAKGAPWE